MTHCLWFTVSASLIDASLENYVVYIGETYKYKINGYMQAKTNQDIYCEGYEGTTLLIVCQVVIE